MNTVASLELRTYNLTANPDLLNKSSEMFKQLEHKFCVQVGSGFQFYYILSQQLSLRNNLFQIYIYDFEVLMPVTDIFSSIGCILNGYELKTEE